jgi:hypothetical protein
MKGVFIISPSLHDIVFMSVDREFRRHSMLLAYNRGLIEV